MDLLLSFFLTIVLGFTSGSPIASRSLKLISCPKDSVIIDQFQASSPCSVFCLNDDDCGPSGLACCSTNCGTRCVAKSILWRTTQDTEKDEFNSRENDDDEIFIDKPDPDKGSLIEKQLSVFKDKLNKKRKETKDKWLLEDNNENKEDQEEEDNEQIEEEQDVIEEDGDMIGEEASSSSPSESSSSSPSSSSSSSSPPSSSSLSSSSSSSSPSASSSPPSSSSSSSSSSSPSSSSSSSPSSSSPSLSSSSTYPSSQTSSFVEASSVMPDEDNDDIDDEGEFDDYSYDEEEAADDLEMLLMKLLLTLKSKQNAKHPRWSDVAHSSRSLLEQSAERLAKNDFSVNAMPPAEALEETAFDEETRELDDRMDGFFVDEPFMEEEIKSQGAGRRSSMERREPVREIVQEEPPDMTNELFNYANAMR